MEIKVFKDIDHRGDGIGEAVSSVLSMDIPVPKDTNTYRRKIHRELTASRRY